MKIAQKYIELIKGSKDLKNAIQYKTGYSYNTLRRKLNENDEILTTADNLLILAEVLKVPQSKLLVKS